MSDVTLTSGIRNTLLALQNTSNDLTTTQEHLATGKKVNTAFDNPSAYFTSQSLSYRASSLSTLLDQIGQGQQTLEAANNGLTSLTDLLQQALSTVQQAQQAVEPTATTYGAVNLTGGVGTAETIGTTTSVGGFSGANGTLGAGGVGNLTINSTVNGVAATPITVALVSTDTAATVAAKINQATGGGVDGNVTASANSAGQIVLTANDANVDFTVAANATSVAAGLTVNTSTATTVNSTDLFTLAGAASGTLTLAVDGGATQTITVGTGAGDVSTVKQLDAALQNLNVPDLTASVNQSNINLSVAASSAPNTLTIGGGAAVLAELGLAAGTTNGNTIPGAANATRSTLQTNYNNLLTQIDQLASDASYNGVNLLEGNNLNVIFNETNTSSLNIQGVTFNSAGLGLSSVQGSSPSNGFQDDNTLASTLTSINGALATVQAQTETFGNNNSTITTRQTFETNMINTLQTGSSNLVLADNNLESANLLTEQTQQQLEISSLSIANQTNQSVLKLFG